MMGEKETNVKLELLDWLAAQAELAFARAVRDHALEHGVGLVVVETGREELDPV